jgi:hypothetical protein
MIAQYEQTLQTGPPLVTHSMTKRPQRGPPALNLAQQAFSTWLGVVPYLKEETVLRVSAATLGRL